MITIEKWSGLVTNASPYAIPPGAAVTQVNVQCLSPGQVSVRPGVNSVTSGGTQIVQMVRFDSATQQRVAVVSYAGEITLVSV
jgi:hypothetical protein